MRMKILLPALFVVFLAACGGSSSTPATNPNSTAAATSSAATAAPAGGKADCVAIKAAAVELISVQFLAQLKTADFIASVKAKQIGNLDLDRFLAAMKVLHALDGHAGVFGDPKPAIDFYEKVANAAKVLFATEPMTQAAIDTYNANVGDLTAFLGRQTAIAGGMDAVGC
jgi:hypothetical protein